MHKNPLSQWQESLIPPRKDKADLLLAYLGLENQIMSSVTMLHES